MKKETADRLTRAFEQAVLQTSDQPTAEAAIDEVIRAVTALLVTLRKGRSIVQSHDLLLAMDEPSPFAIRLIEASLRYAPRMFRGWFVRASKSYLAASQDTGRPEAIPVEQQRAVCDQVLDLIDKGRSESKAKREVAKTYCVHSRTIHRIWIKRKELPQEVATQQEAEFFIQKLFEAQPLSTHDGNCHSSQAAAAEE